MKRTFLRSSLICVVLILGFTFGTANSELYDIPGFNSYNLNIEPEYIYDPTWWLLDIGLQFREEVYYVDYYGATLANKPVDPFISPYSPGWRQYSQFIGLSDIGFDQVPKTIYNTPDLFSVQDIHYAMYGLPIFTQFPSPYGSPYAHTVDSEYDRYETELYYFNRAYDWEKYWLLEDLFKQN